MKKKLYLVILSGILFVIGFIFIYSKTVHHAVSYTHLTLPTTSRV